MATGTHLSHPRTEAAVLKALTLARKHGARTALDIDYRPNLWGVAGHGEGESRFVESAAVTKKLQATLHLFDLIVGTEEEFHIAGGSTDTLAALRAVRAVSDATLVCKRGATGAVAFTGAIPASLDDGETGPGFPIEVFNVLGAGDGFFSGLLKGWMDGRRLADRAQVRQRLRRLRRLAPRLHPGLPVAGRARLLPRPRRRPPRPAQRPAARADPLVDQPQPGGDWPEMRVFAFDHRMQLEEMDGATPEKIGAFKELCLRAALAVADGRPGYGILCDNRLGRAALHAASGTGLWIGRPCEWPGSRPLTLEPELGSDCGGLARMGARGRGQGALLLPPGRRAGDARRAGGDGEAALGGLAPQPARVPARDHPVEGRPGRRRRPPRTLIRQFYAAGVCPDWWKLEPMTSRAAWANAIAAIEAHDAHTRGIVVLGLDAPEAELAASFETAAGFDLVKGFAVGRTIFGEVARALDDGRASTTTRRSRRWPGATPGSARVWDKARADRAGGGGVKDTKGGERDERHDPADRGAGDDALAERADDRGRRRASSRASGRSSATATSPASARRCTASATRCRPGAARTSRPWPTPPSPTPRPSAAAARTPSPPRSARARPTW